MTGNIRGVLSRGLQFLSGHHNATRLILGLAFIILAPILQSTPVLKAQPPYVTHLPILIGGNAGFTVANGVTMGSGTSSDPFIISGWDINASTANGIQISNSNAYFIIRNVFVHSGMGSRHYGIVLSHLVNGRIEYSSLTKNYEGIWLNVSDRVQVSNNHLFLNSIGADFGGAALTLTSTNDTTITNNNVTDNTRGDIIVYGSKNVNLTRNIAAWTGGIASTGVLVSTSANVMVVNNTIWNSAHYGLWLDASTSVRVYHNNLTGNGLNGRETGGGGNSWDNGYPSGGNYWSDYWLYFQTEDNCSGPSQNVCTGPDGIGDTPYTLQTGQQDHYPLVVHHGAVLSIQAPSSVVRGKTALVNVSIANLGSVAERHFAVTLSYGSTQIGSQILADFPPRPFYPLDWRYILNFSWDTGVLLQKGVLPGDYVLTASVILPLESNTSNNSKSVNVQVLGFPSTPSAFFEGIGPLLVLISGIVAVGIIAVFVILILFRRQRKTRDSAV